MSVALSRVIRDVQELLKKTPKGVKKGKAYWDVINSQVTAEGAWDEDLLNSIKGEILEFLNKYKKDQLLKMWKDTGIAADFSDDLKALDTNRLKKDLSEELLNKILDSLDSSGYEEESYFTRGASRKKYSDDGDDDDDFREKFDDFEDPGYDADVFDEDDDGY